MQDCTKIKVKKFIETHINGQTFDDESDIFQLGYVNSLFAMQLVNFVEKEFNIKVENEELNINNFNCVNNLIAYVNSKLGQNVKKLKLL